METIGIIAAISQETEALLQRIEQWERVPFGPLRAYRFRILERNCLLIESGMGVKRAAFATHALLAVANPQFLVSFGVAGAVKDDLQIGDVVLAENTCLWDKGDPSPFHRLASFSDTARNAAAQVLKPRGARLFSGTAITTGGSQIVVAQSERIDHPVLEMETVGIARVAEEKGLPLLSLRAISDCPREPIPFDLGMILDEDANLHLGKLIQLVIGQPKILIQSMKLSRNVKTAADNAAMALIAALRQPIVTVSQHQTGL
jgi:adenosylhomocysteine nucleosidase